MKLEFSRQIFEKYSDIKFNDNPSSWSRVVPCGQTDRHEEANSHLSQFSESAKKMRAVDYLADYLQQS
jgi:hypothetical protein